MLENREIMMRLFPDAFAGQSISPVGNYPERLLQNLRAVAPSGADDPVVVLLTPGRYNSAYFEHVFLAEQMGIELVEGGDLFVRDGYVWMRTTEGPVKVDVIYRGVDDFFMDPLAFRSDSTLGIPGLLSVIRSGRMRSPTRSAPASPTTRRCMSTCRASSPTPIFAPRSGSTMLRPDRWRGVRSGGGTETMKVRVSFPEPATTASPIGRPRDLLHRHPGR